jgi:hypothetical protein
MATKSNNGKAHDFSKVAAMPRPLDDRLSRIEDLLVEMRHEQDVMLKRLAKTQAQLDALVGKPPSVAHLTDLFKLRQ